MVSTREIPATTEVRNQAEIVSTWAKSASRDTLISGVGCPMCKHEGPYWVEACALHTIIHDMSEGARLDRTISDDMAKRLNAIHEKLGLDEEGDALSQIDDLIAAEAEAMQVPDLLEPLKWIAHHYANQDMNHRDFRVEAAQRAEAAIQKAQGDQS